MSEKTHLFTMRISVADRDRLHAVARKRGFISAAEYIRYLIAPGAERAAMKKLMAWRKRKRSARMKKA